MKFHAKMQILKLLKQNKFGSSAYSISNELHLARNTVIKYLESLKKEKLAYEWYIGRYRIWIHRDFYNYLDELKAPEDYMIYSFLRELLQSIQSTCKVSDTQWHAIGQSLSQNIDFKKYFPAEFILQTEKKYLEKGQNISEIIKYYPALIENVLLQLGDSTVIIDPPILNQEPLFVIFRLRNSKFCKTPTFFKILCGIKEFELKPYYSSLKVSISGYYPEKNIVDLKYSFDD
ncbi:hypothetical protein [Candidatus Lokiarchaeum ossiferum]|uniref:hypothetical protein n=1 Tax=Candidatus Lokiarchaeum ossiferum TaxID=2951803 RepID=UPI00352E9460